MAQQEFNLNSYAFFGEGTLSISGGFRVIGGLRYTYEKTTTDGSTNGMLPPTSTPAYDPAVDPFDFPINGRATANGTGHFLDASVLNESAKHAIECFRICNQTHWDVRYGIESRFAYATARLLGFQSGLLG